MRALWSVLFGHHPQTRAVEIQDLEPVVPAVDEHEQSTMARILPESFAGHGVQPIETLAHITGFEGNEDLETAGKA